MKLEDLLPNMWDKEKPLMCDNTKIDASVEAGKRVRNYIKGKSTYSLSLTEEEREMVKAAYERR